MKNSKLIFASILLVASLFALGCVLAPIEEPAKVLKDQNDHAYKYAHYYE